MRLRLATCALQLRDHDFHHTAVRPLRHRPDLRAGQGSRPRRPLLSRHPRHVVSFPSAAPDGFLPMRRHNRSPRRPRGPRTRPRGLADLLPRSGHRVRACHAARAGRCVRYRAAPRAPSAGLRAVAGRVPRLRGERAGADGSETTRLAPTLGSGHAPLPRNDAERLVFGQLYESLIRVDCQGRALPGLAATWEQAPGDRWAFTLRDNARFWDGAPVTARDVLASWRSHDATLAASLTVTGDRTFTVAASDAPFQRLADQALAATKPAPGGGWPIGTGRYWMTSGDPASPDALVAQPMARSGQPVVKIATGPAGGARDALDGGADVLITDDAATLDYARSATGYVDVPLEWSRT